MPEFILWVIVVLLSLGIVGLGTCALGLLRQQGRILLRLEELEAKPGRVSDKESAASGRLVTDGLPVGTPAPSFRLPDLEGRLVALEELRGRRLLLVHWSTTCGYCHQIADELGRLQDDLAEHRIDMLLLSYGDLEQNLHVSEVHGLDCPILLQPADETAEVFRGTGTPVAYLLDEEGRVAEPLAVGALAVPELARRLAGARRRLSTERELMESRIERAGLKAGTPAPSFELPRVGGGTLSLGDYRGRRVLLVFSDPHCGPCDALLPDLVQLDRAAQNGHPALVMVSRGEPEDNRRKADEHGITFPLALQPGWNVSKQYGIFATPVAFLVDEQGVIAREVAIGSNEILALAKSAGEKGGAHTRMTWLFRPRREAGRRSVA